MRSKQPLQEKDLAHTHIADSHSSIELQQIAPSLTQGIKSKICCSINKNGYLPIKSSEIMPETAFYFVALLRCLLAASAANCSTLFGEAPPAFSFCDVIILKVIF